MGRPRKHDVTTAVNPEDFTLDKMEQVPVDEPEPQTKMTLRQKAEMEGARWLEPLKKMPPIGKLKPEWKKEHDLGS